MDYLESIKNDNIFFLEIGAYNGKSFDGLYKYTSLNNWTGILVEPIKEYFQDLKLNFKNIENKFFENSAITEEDGEFNIKRIVGDKKWMKGSSTLVTNDNTKKYEYVEEKINGITFNTLVNKYNITKIDVLQIDTEGSDLIILEQRHLIYRDKMKLKKILRSAGYTIKNCKNGGLNYLCWQI